MRAGSLDRRITIEQATLAQDGAGQAIETWSTFIVVWASRSDVRGRERFASQQELATRTATYRCRWVAGVNESMRIQDAGSVYRIVGIADNRRRNWMEFTVTALNPQDVE